MKTISQIKIFLLCGVITLFFSCKNKDVPSNAEPDNQVSTHQDTTSENSAVHNDTTSAHKDTINGTTPTGSNDRGQ